MKSAQELFPYLPNNDNDPATREWNQRMYDKREAYNLALSNIKGVDLFKNSTGFIDRAFKHKEKTGEMPDWYEGVVTICNNAITEANIFIGAVPDLLHRFFNSRSDANKYLTAQEQEDLESEFSEWVISEIIEFGQTPQP
jgi:hypothetical protein